MIHGGDEIVQAVEQHGADQRQAAADPAAEEVARAQTALDKVNNTETMEIDL